jgi:hypothetical protein
MMTATEKRIAILPLQDGSAVTDDSSKLRSA